MRSLTLRCALALAAAVTFLAGASAAQAHVVHHVLPKHRVGRGTSTNWSGYAVDGTGATRVIGTWTAETAQCGAGETSWSSPWVGIDGDNSNTVEQTGTDSDCNGGTPDYYAWYEMYPKNAVVLPMTVTPGHTYTGSVTYSGGIFTLSLTDDTSHVTDTENIASKKAHRSSVEWIMEGPSNGLLTNFGTEPFSAASGSISGTSGGLSAFGSTAQSITMVNGSGTTRALPSAVNNNAFSVAWKHS
jgi:hypothetical protein